MTQKITLKFWKSADPNAKRGGADELASVTIDLKDYTASKDDRLAGEADLIVESVADGVIDLLQGILGCAIECWNDEQDS